MDFTGIEAEMARLDALIRPIATRKMDPSVFTAADFPKAIADMAERHAAELEQLGVAEPGGAVLRAVIDAYPRTDEAGRVALRQLMRRYPSFRWGVRLPEVADPAANLRDRLLLLSVIDQGDDTRDEILTLQAWCAQARQAGVDVDPVVAEVAALSSTVDLMGMGSMREVFQRYSGPA